MRGLRPSKIFVTEIFHWSSVKFFGSCLAFFFRKIASTWTFVTFATRKWLQALPICFLKNFQIHMTLCKFLCGDSVLTLNYKYYQVTSSVKTFYTLHFRSRYRPKRQPPQIDTDLGGGGCHPNVHLKGICRKTLSPSSNYKYHQVLLETAPHVGIR